MTEEFIQEEFDFSEKAEEVIEETPVVTDILPKEKSKAKYVDYSTPISAGKGKSVSKLARERLGDQAIDDPEELDFPNLHVISLEEWAASTNKKVILTYYTEDDILTDNDSNPIADPEVLLGDAALMNFGDGSGDPDTVYVRNDDRSIDYEVVRLFKSYSESVRPIKEIKDHTKKRRVKKVIDFDEPEEEG